SLFWLDGHYSGGDTAKGGRETPIMEEIQAILAHPVRDHIILIDDAGAFGTWPDYPTLEQFEKLIATTAPNLPFTLNDDTIRVTAKKWQKATGRPRLTAGRASGGGDRSKIRVVPDVSGQPVTKPGRQR